jgi:hypothetical protein
MELTRIHSQSDNMPDRPTIATYTQDGLQTKKSDETSRSINISKSAPKIEEERERG